MTLLWGGSGGVVDGGKDASKSRSSVCDGLQREKNRINAPPAGLQVGSTFPAPRSPAGSDNGAAVDVPEM